MPHVKKVVVRVTPRGRVVDIYHYAARGRSALAVRIPVKPGQKPGDVLGGEEAREMFLDKLKR